MDDRLRLPPQNLDSERGVLGSIMFMNEAIDEVGAILNKDDFYSDAHQKIYSSMIGMYERGIRGIDAITLCEDLVRKGLYEDVGGAAYIAQIIECVPHAAHVLYYAGIVLEASRKRKVIYGCTDAMRHAFDGYMPSDEIVGILDSLVLRLQGLTGKDISTIDEAVTAFEKEEQNPSAAYPTGVSGIDRMLKRGGLRETHLIVVAARPSGGKSALAGQFSRYSAQRGVPSLIVSLEMAKEEMAERYIEVVDRKALRGLPIYFAESAFSIDRIRQVIRLSVRKHKIKFVFVDYLQLVDATDQRKSRDQQIAEVSRGLKLLAKQLSIPIVVGCQLNRGSEKENRKPQLRDLRESGAIEQDADVVMLIHHEEDSPASEIIIAKQRGGSTGIVPVVFNRNKTVFTDRDPSEGFKF